MSSASPYALATLEKSLNIRLRVFGTGSGAFPFYYTQRYKGEEELRGFVNICEWPVPASSIKEYMFDRADIPERSELYKKIFLIPSGFPLTNLAVVMHTDKTVAHRVCPLECYPTKHGIAVIPREDFFELPVYGDIRDIISSSEMEKMRW